MSTDTGIAEEGVFAPDSLIEAIERRLAELKDTGIGNCCPVGSYAVEAMMARYEQRPSRYLLTRIERALSELESDFSDLKEQAEDRARILEKSCADSKDELNSLLASGQYAAVKHLGIRKNDGEPTPAGKISKLKEQVQSGELVNPAYSGTLSFDDFLRSQEEEILEAIYQENNSGKRESATADKNREPLTEPSTEPLGELRSIKHFRDSWVKMNSEKLLAQAIADTPKDAGPLNSHRLAIQSLTAMRDLSPEYLNRFLSYLETLLWLEKAGESIGLKPRAKAKNTSQNR